MAISEKEIKHIAQLARLKLDDSEIKTYSRQLSDILNYVEQIDKLDLKDVEPLSSVLDAVNVAEPDTVRTGFSREEVMKNDPGGKDPYFSVPKVIDNG